MAAKTGNRAERRNPMLGYSDSIFGEALNIVLGSRSMLALRFAIKSFAQSIIGSISKLLIVESGILFCIRGDWIDGFQGDHSDSPFALLLY
jgi:hypothetical protein